MSRLHADCPAWPEQWPTRFSAEPCYAGNVLAMDQQLHLRPMSDEVTQLNMEKQLGDG
jgi:hypothetical protein